MALSVMSHVRGSALPSEAEDKEGQAQERGHGVADQGSGVARTQVEAEPEGSEKGKELTGQEVHLLLLLRIKNVTTVNSKQELSTTEKMILLSYNPSFQIITHLILLFRLLHQTDSPHFSGLIFSQGLIGRVTCIHAMF